ncbi:hypothetical protein PAPYR_13137 [Paratrimastix pyriformis]|uniref:Uncharacterized protein n=1 Tax=Paratrimastix pyriformis TaxID=342808 RepID=A0ABQ8U5R4_9EUKA|nr:hypothetical protein PAPYR_13137 [Paratrimastix pyriformis]
MNSIDWNQFHTPKKPLSIARVRSARTPEMGRGLPGDQLPLGAGLMTPYHLELIRQTFDGLFRPSSPDSAGKDLLLDIGLPPRRQAQGGPGGRQAQEGSRGPEEGKKAAPVAAKSKKEAAKEAKAAAPAPATGPPEAWAAS